VKPSVEVAAQASSPVNEAFEDEQCMEPNPPFIRTSADISQPSVLLDSFYALCENESGFVARQMPMYLDSFSDGIYRYQSAAPCEFKWAFSNALPGIQAYGDVDVYYDKDIDPAVPTAVQTRSFGDTTLTQSLPSDFQTVPGACTLQRADGVQTTLYHCKLAFAGDLNGDTHTDFVFRILDFPGCEGTETLVSTPTGWTTVRRAR
jgi:hypothetical protein